ncbi:MAG TPA: protein kinase [Polyangiaceae bacterium]|jgi:serine/threonine-protein kinase|nr:protein kinase [Polyangiaceae bacterium]
MSERRRLRSSPGLTEVMPYPPGTAIAGRYLLERLVGEGRTGCVVVARDRQRDQLVAVKFMHGRYGSEAATWFLREARAVAKIDSEHVARVCDSGVLGDGAPYVVTEHLEGMNLRAMLDKRPRLPVSLAISYAMQACEGLAEAHALGIVHRDIKPSNLFLARRQDGSIRLKLLDFGSSKGSFTHGRNPDDGDSSVTLVEPPLYMAPEQIRSLGDVDRRADLWALGVVLYEMLAGRTPFEAGTPAEIGARVSSEFATPLRNLRADVPAALEAVVSQCLEKDPNHRFRNVAAFAQSLSVVGTPGARKAAERIARLVQGAARGSRPPAVVATAVVPSASLTDTRFGRAVQGIDRIVRGELARPDEPGAIDVAFEPPAPTPLSPLGAAPSGPPLPFLQPSETPPPFASAAMVAPARSWTKLALRLSVAGLGIALVAFVATRARIRTSDGTDRSRAAASTVEDPSPPGSAGPLAPDAFPASTIAPHADDRPGAPARQDGSRQDDWSAVVPPAANHGPPAPSASPAAPPSSRPRRRRTATPTSTAPTTTIAPPSTAAPVGTDGFGGRE